MEDNIFDKVHEVDLKKTMEDSYIDYAMSVIASRALPDVRDGERYRFPCPSGRPGRPEAGAEKDPLLNDRTQQRPRQAAS